VRLAGLALVFSGCSLYTGGEHVVPLDAGGHACDQGYTATIFEPADGAVVTTDVQTRIRWNGEGIPDRYEAMADHYDNFFISSGYQVNGDGSISERYTLPAGGSFTFEIGWICDAGNDGPEVILATAHFTTM